MWQYANLELRLEWPAVLLIVKSGVSNHTAFDIPDDPCLSKFGALRRMSPHATDNFRAFVWRLYRC